MHKCNETSDNAGQCKNSNIHTLNINLLAARVLRWEGSKDPVQRLVGVAAVVSRAHVPAVVGLWRASGGWVNSIIDVALDLSEVLISRVFRAYLIIYEETHIQ
jgi:hypothetical protein